MRKRLLLKCAVVFITLVGIWTTTSTTTVHADGNPCTSCNTYGAYYCCQTFYYTPAGWVPLSDPTWDLLLPD